MKAKISILLFSLILGVSCSEDKTPKQISKDGMQVTLPGFVKEDELAEDASIEYANRFRNFYIVAMKVKEDDSVWEKTTNRIALSLEARKVDSVMSDHTIITHIKGNYKEETEPIFYTMKLISNQSNEHFLLTVWTRGDERYKKQKETIDDIINSFKLADN